MTLLFCPTRCPRVRRPGTRRPRVPRARAQPGTLRCSRGALWRAGRRGSSGPAARLQVLLLWLTEGDTSCVHPAVPWRDRFRRPSTLPFPQEVQTRSGSVCRDHGATRGLRPPRATGGLPARVRGMRWARAWACCRPSGQSSSSPVGGPKCRKAAARQRARARALCHWRLERRGHAGVCTGGRRVVLLRPPPRVLPPRA